MGEWFEKVEDIQKSWKVEKKWWQIINGIKSWIISIVRSILDLTIL